MQPLESFAERIVRNNEFKVLIEHLENAGLPLEEIKKKIHDIEVERIQNHPVSRFNIIRDE